MLGLPSTRKDRRWPFIWGHQPMSMRHPPISRKPRFRSPSERPAVELPQDLGDDSGIATSARMSSGRSLTVLVWFARPEALVAFLIRAEMDDHCAWVMYRERPILVSSGEMMR